MISQYIEDLIKDMNSSDKTLSEIYLNEFKDILEFYNKISYNSLRDFNISKVEYLVDIFNVELTCNSSHFNYQFKGELDVSCRINFLEYLIFLTKSMHRDKT